MPISSVSCSSLSILHKAERQLLQKKASSNLRSVVSASSMFEKLLFANFVLLRLLPEFLLSFNFEIAVDLWAFSVSRRTFGLYFELIRHWRLSSAKIVFYSFVAFFR